MDMCILSSLLEEELVIDILLVLVGGFIGIFGAWWPQLRNEKGERQAEIALLKLETRSLKNLLQKVMKLYQDDSKPVSMGDVAIAKLKQSFVTLEIIRGTKAYLESYYQNRRRLAHIRGEGLQARLLANYRSLEALLGQLEFDGAGESGTSSVVTKLEVFEGTIERLASLESQLAS